MSKLATLVKTKTKSTSTSDKNPQFYNAEKSIFIANMVSHEDSNVRLAAVSDEHCPSKILQARLKDEEDKDVIRAILMNPRLPKKSILTFATKDSRATMFDNDEDLIEYIDSLNLEQ